MGGVGIGSGGTISLDRVTFVGNSADRGGGLFNSGTATLTITDSSFQYNTSPYTGAGVKLYGISELINVTFHSNNAEYSGGGISMGEAGSAILRNVTLVGNDSGGNGGGINVPSTATLELEHVTFSGNTSDYPGNAIQAATGATVTTISTIFSSNESGDTCFIESVDDWTSNGCNLSSDSSCDLTSIGDLINKDPLFGIFADYGGNTDTLPILYNSPALDAGNPSDPADRRDQRGVALFDADGDDIKRSDIGAFEYPPYFGWLPLIIR